MPKVWYWFLAWSTAINGGEPPTITIHLLLHLKSNLFVLFYWKVNTASYSSSYKSIICWWIAFKGRTLTTAQQRQRRMIRKQSVALCSSWTVSCAHFFNFCLLQTWLFCVSLNLQRNLGSCLLGNMEVCFFLDKFSWRNRDDPTEREEKRDMGVLRYHSLSCYNGTAQNPIGIARLESGCSDEPSRRRKKLGHGCSDMRERERDR